MTRIVALPHLQTSAVEPSDWLVTIRGNTQPLPTLLKGWDYETPLRFECEVAVDRDAALRDCGLPGDAEVEMVALWWASSTNRRRLGASARVESSGAAALVFDVPADQAGGKLVLIRQLVLRRSGTGPTTAFAATQEGSILWSEDRSTRAAVHLEGEATRFPTEICDFSLPPVLEPNAAWWLEHDFSDLDASPLAALRLYVNGSHMSMRAMAEGDLDGTVAKFMYWDVARTMVHGALDSEEFIERWSTFQPGSLGEALEFLLRKIWPTADARSLRQLRSQDPGLFEARLQGRLDLLGAAS